MNRIIVFFKFIYTNLISILIILLFILTSVMDKNIRDQVDYQKKNINTFLSEFLDIRFTNKIKTKDLDYNLKKYNEIRNNLDKNAVLFLTHGVVTPKSPDNYYFNEEGFRDNDKFLKSLADITDSNYSFFLRWRGNITHEERIRASKEFSKQIKQKLEDISKINGKNPKEIAVNLSGHSFGASIFILTANILKEEGYNIQMLFTFNCPNNTHKLNNKDIYHVNLFSYYDWVVQIFGSIYVNRNFMRAASFGPARLKFNNAINICIDPLMEKNKLLFFKNNKPDKKIYANIYHHAPRNEKLLNEINNRIKNISSFDKNISNKKDQFSKIWEGIYKIENEKDLNELKITFHEDRIKILNNYSNKEIIEIYPDNLTEFKKEYTLKFIPFYSYGKLSEDFKMTEDFFYYKADCFISILYASSRYNFMIKINRNKKSNDLSVKYMKKGNLKEIY